MNTGFSKMNIRVMQCASRGDSIDEIAEKVCRSPHSVAKSEKCCRDKLGAKNRAHMIYLAMKRGIITTLAALFVAGPMIDDGALRYRIGRVRTRTASARSIRPIHAS